MPRLGVDFGGTKIEAAVLDESGRLLARRRIANPGAYEAAIAAVAALIAEVEGEAGVADLPVGVGAPGSASPVSGLIRNANSTWLNGRAFADDLRAALGRPVRLANDANCFALSEAVDGAGAGAGTVFGVILGTGCGGGLVVDRRPVDGANGIAGEWGHTPLPWPTPEELGIAPCWCGRRGCLETWISGPGLAADFERAAGRPLSAEAIIAAAAAGDREAGAAFALLLDRLARGLAVVCDILDPDIIVLGGGLSNAAAIYDRIGPMMARHIFSDVFATRVVRARHGDSSGVRGAAWLWPAA